ncbi:MAG: hypothetical protein PHU25_03570 [Deltaproteobacteria bacterium]|nr:hypothetical protein [Deltaproteobacteria bacterium]
MFLRFARKTMVRDLREGGELVVEGKVAVERPLTLPGSATKCVYYDILNEAFETGARGRGRKMWVPKHAEQKITGFFVDDGTGRVWVAAETATADVRGGKTELGVIGKKGNARYVARLVQEGFVVRVKGLADKARAAEPGEIVLRPGAKGRIIVLVKKI